MKHDIVEKTRDLVAVLVARKLSCGYQDRPVLSEIDLELRAGEVTALIGKNGSGKTTLFKALAGDLRPSSGQALIRFEDGSERDAYSLKPRERALAISRVLQAERPAWATSVRDYVLSGTFARSGWFAGSGHEEARAVDEAIESAELGDFKDRSVFELSGGEFKRVLIARALAQGGRAILLDEPMADLDLACQADILGLLKRLAARGVAIALSVHDLNVAAIVADRVALLAGGRLAALGNPSEVITEENIRLAFGAQVHVGSHPSKDLPQIAHIPGWLNA